MKSLTNYIAVVLLYLPIDYVYAQTQRVTARQDFIKAVRLDQKANAIAAKIDQEKRKPNVLEANTLIAIRSQATAAAADAGRVQQYDDLARIVFSGLLLKDPHYRVRGTIEKSASLQSLKRLYHARRHLEYLVNKSKIREDIHWRAKFNLLLTNAMIGDTLYRNEDRYLKKIEYEKLPASQQKQFREVCSFERMASILRHDINLSKTQIQQIKVIEAHSTCRVEIPLTWIDIELPEVFEIQTTHPHFLDMRKDKSVFVDMTPIKKDEKGIERFSICSSDYKPTYVTGSGSKLKLLGYAVVLHSPSNEANLFSHVSERFVYCSDSKLYDYSLHYGTATRTEIRSQMAMYYQTELEGRSEEEIAAYIKSLGGRVFISKVLNPSSYENYGMEMATKGNWLREVWLDLPEKKMHEALVAAKREHEAQRQKIVNLQTLPQYNLLSRNCIHPILEHLAVAGINLSLSFPATPTSMYAQLTTYPVDLEVHYPSQREIRMFYRQVHGKSTFQESIVPLATDSRTDSWMVAYPEGNGVVGFVGNRAIGVANTAAGVVETVSGIGLTALDLITFRQIKAFNGGPSLIGRGLGDTAKSVVETAGLRIRYGLPTNWSEDEKIFFGKTLSGKLPVLYPYLMDKVNGVSTVSSSLDIPKRIVLYSDSIGHDETVEARFEGTADNAWVSIHEGGFHDSDGINEVARVGKEFLKPVDGGYKIRATLPDGDTTVCATWSHFSGWSKTENCNLRTSVVKEGSGLRYKVTLELKK